MYFFSIFISPYIWSYTKNISGLCDINITNDQRVSIEKIYRINNISKLVHFYESPTISLLDKMQKIEEYDFENSPGFHIWHGGLFDDFPELFTSFTFE
jgi:hypothetical protein